MKVICLNDMKFSFLRHSMATKCLFKNSRIQLQNYGQNRCHSFLRLKLDYTVYSSKISIQLPMFLSKICFLLVVLAIWSFPLDLFDGLCIYCLVSHSKILTSASPVKNCNTSALARCVRTLSREEILSCHTCMVGHRTSVFAVSSKGAPHGRLV